MDSNDHRRRVKASRRSLPRTSPRGNVESASRTTSPGSRRIKTLQDNENLLTIDDVPGWMLMRKASLTQERRERLIAALLSCTSTNTVSLMGTHSGQGTITLDPRQRLRNENKRRTHVATAVPLRLVTSGQTQTVLMTKPM